MSHDCDLRILYIHIHVCVCVCVYILPFWFCRFSLSFDLLVQCILVPVYRTVVRYGVWREFDVAEVEVINECDVRIYVLQYLEFNINVILSLYNI